MNNKRDVITICDLKHGIDTKTETLINGNKLTVKMKIQTLTDMWSLIKKPVTQTEKKTQHLYQMVVVKQEVSIV